MRLLLMLIFPINSTCTNSWANSNISVQFSDDGKGISFLRRLTFRALRGSPKIHKIKLVPQITAAKNIPFRNDGIGILRCLASSVSLNMWKQTESSSAHHPELQMCLPVRLQSPPSGQIRSKTRLGCYIPHSAPFVDTLVSQVPFTCQVIALLPWQWSFNILCAN